MKVNVIFKPQIEFYNFKKIWKEANDIISNLKPSDFKNDKIQITNDNVSITLIYEPVTIVKKEFKLILACGQPNWFTKYTTTNVREVLNDIENLNKKQLKEKYFPEVDISFFSPDIWIDGNILEIIFSDNTTYYDEISGRGETSIFHHNLHFNKIFGENVSIEKIFPEFEDIKDKLL